MGVKERILTIRLMEKISKTPALAQNLGVEAICLNAKRPREKIE